MSGGKRRSRSRRKEEEEWPMVPFLPFVSPPLREFWISGSGKKHKEEFHLYLWPRVLQTGPISETTDEEGERGGLSPSPHPLPGFQFAR